ncbi:MULTISPECIES: hypothetical protein [unclassified Corallococcus]|uniref:hypothetical protein n=1 Tax=unclassified Corallococcus TaxID=2685029 RepID=UPI001A90797E|nr:MULTISPECIES: hypothetical protein [unclassified Corallococcus]MBN9688101.1 hypothetical protein [Corallococcus sp. NCSPR001]WAS88089.1 hypothetical protein O0N60_14175 [Corallococcus sp. NCRR]
MLKKLAAHPAFRTAAVLVSVAVAGIVMGMGLEEARYGSARTELERAEAAADELDQEATAAQSGPTRSKRDEAILARTLTYFPPYPRGGRPEALAADYLGPDTPIAVAWFSTQDSSDQVLQHYRQVILDEGLPVVGVRFNDNAGYVGYWVPKDDEVRLMSTLHQGDETIVFVSSARMRNYLERAGRVPAGIPVPRGLQDVASLSLRMEGATNITVSGRVPDTTLSESEQAYRVLLRDQGWSVTEASQEGFQETQLNLTRPGLRGQATLRQPSAQRSVDFHLSLMRAQAAP